MRLDEYLRQNANAVEAVDRFDGFEVAVDGPQDWEAVESRPGIRIWIWPADPYRDQFCANAVLTMHHLRGTLDVADVFEMLCDEQVQLMPGCHERYRSWQPADDGIGIKGMLSSQFEREFGIIGSASQTRIIAADNQTFIAQLTLTALLGSPANWADIRMSVVPNDSASTKTTSVTTPAVSASAQSLGGDR